VSATRRSARRTEMGALRKRHCESMHLLRALSGLAHAITLNRSWPQLLVHAISSFKYCIHSILNLVS
jgi:hypothetical protein